MIKMTVNEYLAEYLDPEVAETLAHNQSIITNPEGLSEDFKNELGMRIPVIYNGTVYNVGMPATFVDDPETARELFNDLIRKQGVGLDLDNRVLAIPSFD